MCGHALKHLLGPVGDIVGAVLTFAGMPELGIPLAAASSAGGEALSGGKIGQDILAGLGGVLAGALPIAGPALGGALDIGTMAGDALVGAGSGVFQGAAAGNPLMGALTGGAGGLAAGALSGLGSGGSTVGAASDSIAGSGGGALPSAGAGSTGIGAGAGAIAAPASIGVPDAGAGFLGSPELGGQITAGLPSATDAVGGAATSTTSAFPVITSSGYGVPDMATGATAATGGGASANPVPVGTSLPASDLSNLSSTAAGNVTTGGGGASGGISGFINNLFGGNSGSSGASGGNSFDSLFGSGAASGGSSGGSSGGIGSLLKDIAPIAALGGVGLNAIRSMSGPLSSTTPYASAEATTANNLNTQGTQLASYLQSGTLPPGVQNSINQAAEAAKAQIRSKYASMGGGDTSAMMQDLANVDQMAATQGTQIATNLLQTGISETGLSAQLYQSLLQAATAQNAALSSSIGNFASALAGQPTVLKAA